MPSPLDALFSPLTIKGLTLPNRIVMAPMTRAGSPDGVPGPDVAAYYRRRAEGGVGLIVTEGTWIPHPSAGFMAGVPRFYGDDALEGWRRVVREVHAAGGRIMPQLWHVGAFVFPHETPAGDATPLGPSGLAKDGPAPGRAMTQADIDAVVAAYGAAAANAVATGFDGIEIHAAHGYLIDQFCWDVTNRRTDRYGGGIADRTRFAVEVLRELRRSVGPTFPIVWRFSQWKLHDYDAKPWRTPAELEQFLRPLVDAGVDVFHCSTRRFWLPEFEGSRLNLAGWTKKITGLPTITVGSITLNDQLLSIDPTPEVSTTGIDELLERLDRGEFDLVAVGRAIIANPDWPQIVRSGSLERLRPYSPDVLKTLD
jgi:2,4-dienoyl-CoA reductase-like NADH-dependent reductase (Old Yellow Enzyme family)